MEKLYTILLTILVILSLSIYSNAETKDHSDNKDNSLDGQGAGKITGLSEDYKLYQNFPNPFNPATIISYKINKGGFVTLKVYNLVGQVVKTIVEQYQESGTYSKQFDASKLSAGVYLYKLQVNDYTSVKRMTLIK